MVQPQPPKFTLEVKCNCRGCRDRYVRENTILKFQRRIVALYGLNRSSYTEVNGTLEIIGEVNDAKMDEVKKLFRKHTSKNNSSSWCCFWASSKNEDCTTTCNAPRENIHPLPHMPIRNNNANVTNNPKTKDASTQTEIKNKDASVQTENDVDHRQRRPGKEEEKLQGKGPVDSRDKGKGKMEEGSSSKQRKGVKLGDEQRPKGVRIRSEEVKNDQTGETPPRGEQRAQFAGDQRGANMHAMPQTNLMFLSGSVIPFGDHPTIESQLGFGGWF